MSRGGFRWTGALCAGKQSTSNVRGGGAVWVLGCWWHCEMQVPFDVGVLHTEHP